MKKCSNGHYYDNKTSKYCPYCGVALNLESDQSDVATKKKGFLGLKKKEKTVQNNEKHTEIIKNELVDFVHNRHQDLNVSNVQSHELPSQETMLGSSVQSGLGYPVGWLVNTKTHHDYTLFEGKNYLSNMNGNIFISNEYNPEVCLAEIGFARKSNEYYIRKIEKDIFVNEKNIQDYGYLNNNVLINVGNLTFKFVSLCGEAFHW